MLIQWHFPTLKCLICAYHALQQSNPLGLSETFYRFTFAINRVGMNMPKHSHWLQHRICADWCVDVDTPFGMPTGRPTAVRVYKTCCNMLDGVCTVNHTRVNRSVQ
jgi:hypothetical protein